MNKEIRYQVTFLYPGFFFPEEGARIQIDNPDVDSVLGVSPNNNWFAAEVTEQEYTRWSSEGQEDKWLPTKGKKANKFRIYYGDALTADDVADLPGNHDILLSNMRGNRYHKVVHTRRGNFQPLEENDVVLS